MLSIDNSLNIPLFYKPLDSPIENDWGLLTYHEINNTAAFIPSSALERSHEDLVCIGTHSIPQSECIALVKNITSGLITVLLQPESNSIRISVGPSSNGFEITIMDETAASVPDFASAKPKRLAKIASKVPGVDSDTHENEEYADDQELELPPHKSWVKRNWMYIVPPLAILLLLLPEDQPTK